MPDDDRRDRALARLPSAYALALRLRAAGVADALIAECLAVEVESVGPLMMVAEEKLAGVLARRAASPRTGGAGSGGVQRALLVIDVQESFRQRPSWAELSNPLIVDQVQRLVTAARAEDDLVVWVLHSEPNTGTAFDPALGHVRLIDGLVPLGGEPVLTKTAHNAFTTSNLQQLLTVHGVRELLISGIRTEQCCETTARIGSDLGYDVTFVTDATATTPLPHWRTGEVLGTAEIAARTEWVLAGRFATIATVAELTGAS